MDRIILDVGPMGLTLSEILMLVEKFQGENPGMEIFFDGDRQAILGRPSSVQRALER